MGGGRMSNDRFRFRVWDVEKRIMHYDAEETYDFMHGKPVIMENCFGDLINNSDYILEQCTGLRDKNGTLIYEGDVVSDMGVEAVVIWFENSFCLKYDDDSIGDIYPKDCEVIGNVHEYERKENE